MTDEKSNANQGTAKRGDKGRRKVFLTAVSQQPHKSLVAARYATEERNRGGVLEYGETSFPIIPVINGYAEDGEVIDLIAIKYDYSHCKENYKTFLDQLRTVCEDKSISCNLTTLTIPNEGSVNVFVKTFDALLGYFEDGDIVYADITYGLKPMSVLLFMLVQYAYRIKKDIQYGCMVYGENIWADKGEEEYEHALRIFDLTPLLHVDTIVDMFGNADPREGAEPGADMPSSSLGPLISLLAGCDGDMALGSFKVDTCNLGAR